MLAAALTLSAPSVCLAETPVPTASESRLDAILGHLVEAGSEYDTYRQMVRETYQGVTFTEGMADNAIEISIASDNEYVEAGTWRIVQDGDYLTMEIAGSDLTGTVLFSWLLPAVAESLGMDATLYPCYVQGLLVTGASNDYVSATQLEDGATLYRLYDAGAFDMPGIDDLYVTEQIAESWLTSVADSDANDHFFSLPLGKIRLVAHGDANSMTVAVGEYGGNTDKTYQSLVNAISHLKPKGYDSFLSAFTSLAKVSGKGYKVTFGLDAKTKEYLGITDDYDDYSFVVVKFNASTSTRPRASRPVS